MRTLKALDLFCGAGGASMGLARAGFEVSGIDTNERLNYPFKFIVGDVMQWLEWTSFIQHFDLVWASPPCQRYTRMQKIRAREHPDLIGPVREKLQRIGVPFVIENVIGAPLNFPVMLCGAMFGLRMYRHRLFEASFPLQPKEHPRHTERTEKAGRLPKDGGFISVAGHFPGVGEVRRVMEVPWMRRDEIAQAIPPAYSEYIGKAAIAHLNS